MSSQTVKEILEGLAIVANGRALELDGDDSSLAVLGTLNFIDDGKLVEVGANRDLVAARHKEEVGNGKIANGGVVDEVGEGGVALEEKCQQNHAATITQNVRAECS